jgi:arylsulfatase A-like enzyme
MKKRSLILVTVDCLRADHVGFSGYSRPVTPFLDSLATSSLVFSDAIVAGAPTYFSFPAIIASRYPLALGRDVLGIAPSEPTIATVLHDAGYATAAFLAGNPYLSPRSGYDQGFDTFRDFLDSALPENSVAPANKGRLSELNNRIQAASLQTPLSAAAYDELYFWYGQWRAARENFSMDRLRRYPAADVMVDQARSWLSSLPEEPFFLWLHLMDPHNPYYPPQEALASLGESKMTARRALFLNSIWNRDLSAERLRKYRPEILSLYDAGVHWVDKQVSRLVRALQQFHRWDETVFVLTADHGTEFLEHGGRYHGPSNLLEELIHVPLLLRAPQTPAAHLSQGPFSQIHLAPTLLEAVGVAPPESFQGRSHWQQIKAGNLPGDPALAECVPCNNPFRLADRMRSRLVAVRDRDYKLVLFLNEKTDCMYDLKNDPEEKSPLPANALPKQRAHLLEVALAHIQKARNGQNAELPLRARLRELQQGMDAKRVRREAAVVPQ